MQAADSLADKVYLITGASSGIGAATAQALVNAGGRVALGARRVDRLQALAEDCGPDRCYVHGCDVTQRSSVAEFVAGTVAHFGRLDGLINNAGVMPLSLMKNLHVDEWERMIDVNLKGALFAMAACLPHLRKGDRGQGGDIINISSTAGRRLFRGGGVYCATKFGLRAASEGLRQELDPDDGVRVVMIEPGAVATELAQAITDQELIETSEFKVTKLLEAEDIARMVLFAVRQPAYVNIDALTVLPHSQNV